MSEYDGQLKKLYTLDKELVLLDHISSLLQWDQETGMPSSGVDERSEQISLLSGMIHRKMTDPDIGSILSDLGASEEQPSGEKDLSDIDRGMVRRYYREYSRQSRIPSSWVQEFSEVTSRAQAAWASARNDQDFLRFQPYLEHIVRLNRDKADMLGYSGHPYDPLLDEFEQGMKTSDVDQVFSAMKADLTGLMGRLSLTENIDDSFLFLHYPAREQDAFGRSILEDMGFDFSRGRMDESAHPFTTSLGRDDIRITTRYSEPSVASGLFSTIHEGGHALYEMGAGQGELAGTSLGSGISLALHESQSRMWENMIGRSREFWIRYYPLFQDTFPAQTRGITLDHFLKGVNKVQSSCIRVNADEVTYGLHIILRFELEKSLIAGDLDVRDLPSAWNEGMRGFVGVQPEHDGDGVLQDIHWSAGMMGYFPTYALGNLYAAQLHAAMIRDIPDIGERISLGEFGSILKWLCEKVHKHGAVYQASDILLKATGESLDPGHFTAYLEKKYGELAGI